MPIGLPFLNDNANRSYPFVDEGKLEMSYSGGGLIELPQDAVVDFLVVAGLDAEYLEDQHRIFLQEILRQGSCFLFRFRSDAPNLVNYEMQFSRLLTDEEFATSVGRFDQIREQQSSASLPASCEGDYVTEGWITTGRLANLASILSNGESLRRPDGMVWVEPAQIQSLYRGYVRSANLANVDRTRATEPDGCPGSLTAGARQTLIHTECITGPIRWKPGYNCIIRQNNTENSLTIVGAVGAGQGEPCDEVELFEGELPPANSKLLSGGPACDEVVKTINGLPGPIVRFIDGRGVRVDASEEDPHTVVVDVNLHGLAVCPSGSLTGSEEEEEEPWLPSALNNLLVWFDAADLATLWQDLTATTPVTGFGDVVRRWNDKSGNGHHVSRPTSDTFQCKYVQAVGNSLGGVDADNGAGGDGTLRSSTIAALGLVQPIHAVCVFEHNDNASGFQYIFGFTNNPTMLAQPTSNRFQASAGTIFNLLQDPLPDTTYRWDCLFNGVASRQTVYGGVIDTTATADAGSTDPQGQLSIFDRDGAAGNFSGALHELIIVAGTISAEELVALYSYLDAKWAI